MPKKREPTFEVTVVIPAYNEALRLPRTLQHLAALIKKDGLAPVHIGEVIVSDDGSSDHTAEAALQFKAELPNLKILRSPTNMGKGHAVRQGLKEAQMPWILVADADMAIPWTEIISMAAHCGKESASFGIGSKYIPGSGLETSSHFLRKTLGKCFNFFVRTVTGLPYKDTQCGFKWMRREDLLKILPYLRTDGFAFDVELLLHAKEAGFRILEHPVAWVHREASSVRPLRDGLSMLKSVIEIRMRKDRPPNPSRQIRDAL